MPEAVIRARKISQNRIFDSAFECRLEPITAVKRQVRVGTVPFVPIRPSQIGKTSMRKNAVSACGHSEPTESGSFAANKRMLKALLRHWDGKRLKRKAARKQKRGLANRGWWLNYCTDCSLDAYTLKDSLRWQKRIVATLESIIDSVAEAEWSTERKSRTLVELKRDLAQHSQFVLNIETAMQKNECANNSPF